MRFHLEQDCDTDHLPVNAAYSAEPFQRPDHKAKRHSRPKGKARNLQLRRAGKTGRAFTQLEAVE